MSESIKQIVVFCISLALITASCEPLAEFAEDSAEQITDRIEEGLENQFLDGSEIEESSPSAGSQQNLPTAPARVLPEPIEESLLLRDFRLPTPLFAPNSAWNQPASDAGVLPESGRQILTLYRVLLGNNATLHPELEDSLAPFMTVSFAEWTIPIFRARDTEQYALICNYDGDLDYTNPKLPAAYEEPGGPVIIPAPMGIVRPSGPEGVEADGHLVLFNPKTQMEYDFWNATTARTGECESYGGGYTGDSLVEAGMVDYFDVRGPGANPHGYFSARAAGSPLLAGLLLPEDIEAGEIRHALAVAIPRPRNTNAHRPWEPNESDVVYPASQAEPDYFNTDPYALAQGQRLRLKGLISLADEAWGEASNSQSGMPIDRLPLAPITRLFLQALHDYGAYVVDNADGFVFYAEDIHTANLRLPNDQINTLIGKPPGTPLPAGKSNWQILMEKLNQDLALVPLAAGGAGPWWEYGPQDRDPASATIAVANFEVVEPAVEP